MSNNPPNINPTGTRYTNVRVHPSFYDGYIGRHVIDFAALTKEYKAMMKVMGEYVKADYAVTYEETYDVHGRKVASLVCEPPLLKGML